MVERGLAPSRERAQALLMAGQVRVNGQKVDKPGASRRRRCAHRAGRRAAALRQPRRNQARRRARGFRRERRRKNLPRCRQLDRRIHRLPAAARRGQGLRRGREHRSTRLEAAQRSSASSPSRKMRATCARRIFRKRPTLIVMDVSFISVTKVLPAVVPVAAPGCRFPDSDQAAIRTRKARHRQGRHRARPLVFIPRPSSE